ncbi:MULTISPECIES: SphA family protein [Dickeya]|uniref:SphA family protein n=1 Tax=Dickeya TaxID=204037 RepID=UPI0002F69766|nr:MULTISPECIES: transporter [Dickeya]
MKMNYRRNITAITFFSPLFLAMTVTPGMATENGTPSTAAGTYDFGAGFLPHTTDLGTFGSRVAYYSAHANLDNAGNKKNAPFSLQVLTMSLAWLKMTDQTLLGGRYGFGVIQPFFKMDTDMVAQTPVGPLSLSSDVFRQADLQVIPLILGWVPSQNLSINTQFQVQAPTGDYDKNRLLNPGLNHWVFSPMLNATYITNSGFEVSSSFQVDFNTENHETDYRNGTEYRYEYAAGQHIGNWTVGIGGYYYNQFSDDRSNSLTAGNRSRTFAYGPAVSYFSPTSPSFWIHAYKEDDSRNRTQGYTIALRVAQSF